MNRLTAIQSEAARIIFDLSEADGFALAGGSALVALGIVDRTTHDIDAFVAARATTPPGDVGPLATAIEAALTERRWILKVIRRHITFTRLLATIRDETIEIDLAVDSPLLFRSNISTVSRRSLPKTSRPGRSSPSSTGRRDATSLTSGRWRSGSAAQSA